MWHGVGEYLLLVALVAFISHAIIRSYAACIFGVAALCSILNLLHEAWTANWQVNIGWGPPMFIVGFAMALPVCALVGFPWLALRRWRSRNA